MPLLENEVKRLGDTIRWRTKMIQRVVEDPEFDEQSFLTIAVAKKLEKDAKIMRTLVEEIEE